MEVKKKIILSTVTRTQKVKHNMYWLVSGIRWIVKDNQFTDLGRKRSRGAYGETQGPPWKREIERFWGLMGGLGTEGINGGAGIGKKESLHLRSQGWKTGGTVNTNYLYINNNYIQLWGELAFSVITFKIFLFLFYKYFDCMYICVLPVCLPGAHICQKRADSLEVELQVVVSCQVGAGNWTGVLWKQQDPLASEPSLQLHFLSHAHI